ncbi:MAG: hypothetical protein LQ345_004098 [Seirophora villosa]|nr:MAG: hypothetical protein LQ345_004098 [Seirophora villosa]
MIKQLREKDEVIRQLQQTTPFVEKNHHHHHHHNNNNNNHHPAALTEQNPTTAVLPPPSPHHHPPPFPAPTPPTPRPSTIKPLISSLRDSHIRLAGHLRTTTAAHTEHEAAVRQLHADLEEGEIAMRRVRNVVKGLVAGAGKVGAELEKAAGESDGVKGRVMALMDRVE